MLTRFFQFDSRIPSFKSRFGHLWFLQAESTYWRADNVEGHDAGQSRWPQESNSVTMFCMPRTANRELVVSLAFDFLCLHREEHSVAAHLHDDDTSLCFRGGCLTCCCCPQLQRFFELCMHRAGSLMNDIDCWDAQVLYGFGVWQPSVA